MPSAKSPKAKPVRAPKPSTRPQQNRGGCLRRVGLPLAALFGLCMVLSVIVSAVQNVGERVGLLPTSTPTPTPTATLTPSATPTVTDTPVPSATPTVTDTPLVTNTPAPTNTAMPTNTLSPTGTATQPPPPTVTSTPLPTATPVPTSTATPAPIAQRNEAVALPLTSAPATTTDANLRSGPGQQYPVIGGTVMGQRLEGGLAPVGQSADGNWLALADGSWIAASLVTGAPVGLAVVSAPEAPAVAQAVEPAATAAPAVPTTPTPVPEAPLTSGPVIIESILYDGNVPDVESDEYVVLVNQGTTPVDLGGWRINAGDEGQDFRLPSFTLPAGGRIRLYTNEVHPETGGISFGSNKPVWLNKGDCGYLFDAAGNEVSRFCY